MNKIKKANRLARLIVQYGKGTISQDRADLIAYRYYSNEPKDSFWDHSSMTQLANNFAMAEMASNSMII